VDRSNTTSWHKNIEGRWCGVGCSSHPDARTAGVEAAAGAMAAPDARLIIVFTSDAQEAEPLLAAIRGVTGEIPLIGCSTAGEITPAGPADATVVVLALGGPGFTVATAAASVHDGSRQAGEDVAQCLREIDAPHKILVLLADSVAANHQEIVRGARSQAGAAIPLVGGCAGEGGLQLHRTLVLKDGRKYEKAVVAAAIGSTGPFGIGVRHGWRAVGEPMAVRWDKNGRLSRLDDEPALDGYLNRLGAPDDVHWDPYLFAAFSQTRPLGLVRGKGEESIRHVGDPNFEDRTLGGRVDDFAEDDLVWVMEGDATSLLDAADAACTDALKAIGGPALGLVVFDCSSRKFILGHHRDTEIGRIAGHAVDAPVAGFYSYGEIATTGGPLGYHQGTLVVLALG
jgi:hypothetical protein